MAEIEQLKRQAAYLTGLTGRTHLVVAGLWVVPAQTYGEWPVGNRPAILWSPAELPPPEPLPPGMWRVG